MMKIYTHLSKALLLCLIFIPSLFIQSCKKDKKDEDIPKTSFSIKEKEVKMKVGEKRILTISGGDNRASIKWASDNEAVVIVNKGELTAIKAGEAIVTASMGNQNESVKVTVSDNGQPKPEKFIPYLIVANGVLKKLPHPLVDWSATPQQIKAKEAEMGAIFDGETKIGYKFTTNDPENNNPIRSYLIHQDGTLEIGVVVKKSLIFSSDELNDNLQILLANEGFKAIGDQMAFSDGKLQIAFISLRGNEQICVIRMTKDRSAGLIPFNPNYKDFPKMDVNPEKLSEAELRKAVEAYENQVGRFYDEKLSQRYKGIAFTAPNKSDWSKYVFQTVIYTSGIEYQDKAGITAITFAIANETMLGSAEVKSYFNANGFPEFKWMSLNQAKFAKYTSHSLKWQAIGAVGSVGGFSLFSFSKLPENTPTPPSPGQKREKFYLPILDAFGQEISLESPFAKEEKKRNFTVSVSERNEYLAKRVMAYPPYDRSVAGISSFSYTAGDKNLDGTTVEEISVMFTPKSYNPGYKHDGTDDPELNQFLEQNRFQFKKTEKTSFSKLTFYYNSEKDITLILMDSRTSLMGTFKKGNLVP